MLYLILAIILFAIKIFYSLVKDPGVPARIAAMNFIAVIFLIVLLLLSYYFEREIYLNVALVYGISIFLNLLVMLNFFKKAKKEESDDRI